MSKGAVSLTGDFALMRALDELGKFSDGKSYLTIGAAQRRALKAVRNAARDKVRDVSPTIADSLKTKTIRYARSGAIMSFVGPDSKYTDPETGHVPAWTAHLVEKGTAPHAIEGAYGVKGLTVQHPGTKPHPFMRPAWIQHERGILSKFGKDLGELVEKRARKLAAKHGVK